MHHGGRASLRGRTTECAAIDALLEAARAGRSGALVLRGEAGIGKTALLEYAALRSTSCRVIRAVGVESEMELPFAALQQFSISLLATRQRLPSPQREALETAFGLSAGPRPDHFLVGLAVLNLLADAADRQPLICLIDDAQWLDHSSAQVISFVARRLKAESVLIVFAERDQRNPKGLAGLPELRLKGLSEADSTELLASVTVGPLDEPVKDRIIAEARGNPLALLELARGLSSANLAGGFAVPGGLPLPRRIEASFRRRVEKLPPDTQRFLLVAAADPVGDPTLLWRALTELGIPAQAVMPAEADDLIEIGARVAFHHPLLRSAIYRAARPDERRSAHAALAIATDPEADPDRRAWHRAHSTLAPNDDVAEELERSADRAERRGGLAAAAAFLERATALTADPALRGVRAINAAYAKFEAGAPDTAIELLATAELSALAPLQRGRLERLRAQIAFMSSRGRGAPQLLLAAAKRLEPLDAGLARATFLDAFSACVYAGRFAEEGIIRDVAEAARAARRGTNDVGATSLLVDSLAIRFTDGYVAAVPLLQRALRALTLERNDQDVDLGLWLVAQIAHEVFDDEAWYFAVDRAVRVARERGALTALPSLLDAQAGARLHEGRVDDASSLLEEGDAISEATGTLPYQYVPMILAAWRGEEDETLALSEARFRDATEKGEGHAVAAVEYTKAVLYNGLGRYEAAFAAAQRACELENLGSFNWALPELIEASVRAGSRDAAEAACSQLEERAVAVRTDWALGMGARARALLSSGQEADYLYRESLERLAQIRITVHLARTQLVYGEWLRRENRRVDARQQLRAAHDFFDRTGANGFAGRAARELLATGETVRKRVDETRRDLTAQEVQIARLAAAGHTNPEIGAQLFLSPRTVEWHLRKVFTKVDVSSRRQLRDALTPAGRRASRPTSG